MPRFCRGSLLVASSIQSNSIIYSICGFGRNLKSQRTADSKIPLSTDCGTPGLYMSLKVSRTPRKGMLISFPSHSRFGAEDLQVTSPRTDAVTHHHWTCCFRWGQPSGMSPDQRVRPSTVHHARQARVRHARRRWDRLTSDLAWLHLSDDVAVQRFTGPSKRRKRR